MSPNAAMTKGPGGEVELVCVWGWFGINYFEGGNVPKNPTKCLVRLFVGRVILGFCRAFSKTKI